VATDIVQLKFGEVRACGFRDMCGKRQTDRHAHCNTALPHLGLSNDSLQIHSDRPCRAWLGRASPKRPILCPVGRETVTIQSIRWQTSPPKRNLQ